MQDETNPLDVTRPEEEHRFPCDQCGSDMRFDAQAGELKCDHCGNTRPIEGHGGTVAAIRELDFRAALDAKLPEAEIEDTRVASCPNCGAQVEFDANTHARECPFCATPVVTDTGTHRHIKPKGLLPFAVEERDAHAAMNKWLGRLWFAPNGLKQYARKGRRMSGIYVPYWTFDADTNSRYTGEHGTVYYVTKTVTRNGKQEQVREQRVRWRPASGRVARFFDDVLVLASRSLPKSFTDNLAPWDLSGLEPYRPEYLAGYRAEGYTVELPEGYDEARDYMDRVILRDVKFDIGGDRQRVHSVDTSVADVTFKHILLPVWLAAYKYRGKTYRFVVNGRSGKVQGERPWSWLKITLAVLAGLILAGIIGFIASQSQ
ncbi:primosomal protein N' (replication factor Y) - superfamily II helicase [Maritimibacter sp. UBA3975]|uniref:primosomal protein N' (replication factor Y) - superfamily II helicase n=1 Tax=Maritimibacter sp. UBA3975 TaxID=1946833 RepID=UPI000C0B3326|nr:primosomal protein N' (replication factor Y) - superfamily II helicase [Maritimibacter sp. UBA3975]MAM62677.1 primosomal protein N' (replication factor Y) - superfamily II helicase [Maritimibacter sp.]|tara:strand:- start:765 stop:1886 length:1122 start_codon:yes stop_codon:yes gene_type:complete